MALNFPTDPVLDQSITFGNTTYIWNGESWVGNVNFYYTEESIIELVGTFPSDVITTTQITNWDEAFGWGDHAGLYSLVDHTHDSDWRGIVNSLDSISTTESLSAKQGKVLKGLIDTINTVLTSDDGTLDEVQEIVTYIKANKATLDALAISNIIGLQDILDGLEAGDPDIVKAPLGVLPALDGSQLTGVGTAEALALHMGTSPPAAVVVGTTYFEPQ